jgi:hypothetical protein
MSWGLPSLRRVTTASLILLVVAQVQTAPIVFTNETDYVNALTSGGYVWVQESFEGDEAWGHVRSTIVGGNATAPAVTNSGIRWTANNDTSQVTTSSGAAQAGDWGVYALPHGNYASGTDCTTPGACGDGIIGTALQRFHGVAAWVRGSYASKVALYLNGYPGTPVGFPEVCDSSGENCIDYGLLTSGSKFFGLIEPAGFSSFEFREMEGTVGDQKFLWFDDFTMAFTNPPPSRIAAVTMAGNEMTLTVRGLAVNADYTLERSSSLSTNDWTAVESFTASGSETNLPEAIGPDLGPRFYRLRSP